jgi:putative sigma-54 modulation protein
MQLSITFRHLDASDSLKDYARERVERVNKYLNHAGEAHIVLSLERHLHHADITIHAGPFVMRGRDKSGDMYASLDLAMDKIEKQLLRYKDRIKHHHGRERVHHRQDMLEKKVRHRVMELAEASPDAQEAPSARIVRTNEFLAKPMSVEDAVMQLDLMNTDFFVFTNSATEEMNVIYRRKDGHYGLIEADAARATRAA